MSSGLKEFTGFCVCWVSSENQIYPSHSEEKGYYQEFYGSIEQAREREQELLDTVGGVWEIVKAKLILERF